MPDLPGMAALFKDDLIKRHYLAFHLLRSMPATHILTDQLRNFITVHPRPSPVGEDDFPGKIGHGHALADLLGDPGQPFLIVTACGFESCTDRSIVRRSFSYFPYHNAPIILAVVM